MKFLTNTSNLLRSPALKAIILRNISNEDITTMVKNNKVVVFMKGIPEQPRCGFSNAVVQILRMHGVKYDSHNVLENEELRQGKLK